MIDRAFGRLIGALEGVLALALLAAISLNCVNVIGRYVFARSITGADELQIDAMIWMAFAGGAVVSWRGEHLRMDALLARMPVPVAAALRRLELLLLLVLAVFVVVHSWRYTMHLAGTVSPMAGIPMWIPHGAVVAGYALIAAICVRHLVKGGRL